MKKPSSPYISIIIATWNAEQTLQHCLDSVRLQSYDNYELLVQDNASNDGTVQVVERNRDLPISLVSERDTGIYDAWNRAVSRARGEWVYFLGADSVLHSPETFSKAAKILNFLDEGVPIAYGKICRKGIDGRVIDYRGAPWADVRKSFFKYLSCIPHAACFQRRKCILDLGGFNEEFKIRGDADFLLKVFKKADPEFIDLVVCDHYMGGVSTSLKGQIAGIQENKKSLRMQGMSVIGVSGKIVFAYTARVSAVILGEDTVSSALELARRFTAGKAS